MPPAWDLSCHYPGCGDGNIVGKKFCPKHVKTPFETKVEVNAYRRAQKEARVDLVWLLATLVSANCIIMEAELDDDEEGTAIHEQMKEICKRWKLQYPDANAMKEG